MQESEKEMQWKIQVWKYEETLQESSIYNFTF